MPSATLFVVYGVLLRLTEGVGWAMSNTTTLAFIPVLFPSHVGKLTVSQEVEKCTVIAQLLLVLISLQNIGADIWSNWPGIYCRPSNWEFTCCGKILSPFPFFQSSIL